MFDMTPEDFRRLGYRAVDLLAEQLAKLPSDASRQPVPSELRAKFLDQPLPQQGTPADALLDRVAAEVLAYPMGNASSRFFAWVNSTPAPLGVLGDLLASGLNPSVAGGDHAGTYVEHAVLKWMKELLGFPSDAGAILCSGGTLASLIGLSTMRFVKTDGKVRARGMSQQSAPLIIYTSTQGHSCIEKDIEMLGIGHEHLRKIPVDDQWRMDMNALRAQIASDRAAGLRPACVAASAGSVNTGAIDPLDQIANLCRDEQLWFHIDAAYGGPGMLAEQTAGLYRGLERADSVAVDPHKWMYVPVECGCALVRNAEAMRAAFSLVPPYLRDPHALPWFSEYGIQQTRGFRALKLWLVLQQMGVEGYRQQITHDIAMSRLLQQRLREADDFELVAAGPLSVCCFRYVPPGAKLDAAAIDALNARILEVVQREGWVFLTATELTGRSVLRACVVNFRTREADVDALLERIRAAAKKVA